MLIKLSKNGIKPPAQQSTKMRQNVSARIPSTGNPSFKGLQRHKPPSHMEPEVSFFPDPKQCDAKSLLASFPDHMNKILQPAPKPRNYREYAITFTLGQKSGTNGEYNFRIRGHLQPLSDGTLTITNLQLTVKTQGNGTDRQEFETADTLKSADLHNAFEQLRKDYPDLPAEIKNINPNDLFVDGVLLNSRIGQNGIMYSGNTIIPEFDSLVMTNSDSVLFTAPQILDSKGQLINLGERAESEIEIKNVQTDLGKIWKFAKNNPRLVLLGLFKSALGQAQEHGAQHFPVTTHYDTGKVDEAQKRAAHYVADLRSSWNTTTPQHFLVPEDYMKPEMQPALAKLLQAVPCPYHNQQQEIANRTRLIQSMREANRQTAPLDEHHMTLVAA